MICLTVPGTPQPKGSTRSFRNGSRIVTTSANPKMKSWSSLVTLTARAHRPKTPWAGPVSIMLRFQFTRPKSAPKSRTAPTVTPDLDKLVRCIFDALTAAGWWEDDARVVSVHATKEYAPSPGVMVMAKELA